MKKKIVLIFILAGIYNLNAQQKHTYQDSINTFYDKIFTVMKKGYLYKNDVNWKEIESKVRKNLTQYKDFNTALKEVTTIFDFAKANHGKVYYNNAEFYGNFPGVTRNDFTNQWLKKYEAKPTFEVKILENEIGYILMPRMMFEDFSSKKIHELAQPMYDEINKVKTSKNIKGWIIDLRFNTGGNCMPMILALYDFLGDNNVWGVLNIDKKKISSIKLSNGEYIDNSKKVSYITPKGALLDKTKVAIITNIGTGSSGEVTALAFKGRENTIFIGEKTNGKTTSNIIVDLPFGAYMTLTVGLDCDRNGMFYEQIVPDIDVSKQDNFDDFNLDGNITEAVKFILN